jgi:hypothetical protein
MMIGRNKNPETYSCFSQFLLSLRKGRLARTFSLSFPMDWKTIVLYLHVKEMRIDTIHEDRARTLGKEAVACSSVTKYIRNARFALKTEVVTPEPAKSRHSCVGEATSAVLEEYPFSSVRELSRLTCLPCSNVHRRLTQ